MPFPIRFSHIASKQFKRIDDKKLKERIACGLEYIAQEPLIGKPLQGEFKGSHSYRIGDYRIIYTFSRNEKYLGIIRIEHRREVYR